MGDVDRDALLSDVLARLADPTFAQLMTATTAEGNQPVLPALLSDLFTDVIAKVVTAGGAGNIVVPMPKGYLVMDLTVKHNEAPAQPGQDMLSPTCTVGLVLARIMQDGGNKIYTVPQVTDSDAPSHATAALVGATS